MTRVRVRPAVPAEHARVGEIVVEAYSAEGYLVRADGSYDASYAAKLADVASRAEGSGVLVAELDGTVVGTVTWCGAGSPMRELASHDGQGEFRMLGVLPEAAGHGVASAMVRWCLDRAAEDGLSEVVISSLPEMLPAHKVYARHDFVRRPDLDWSPVPGTELVAFSRRL
ncbi:GNAT family N-acetyltransferase [Mumia zhuanghuii]|uniref:GNAT family N-acetyltransferase n=1 Tax=Mumia zhuanghuii TaxID=2585211 RepID=A0A5C4MKU5_9ACTN|nr:GNAT family N-acetyltransferase [Mumia zhuanghuii]TNC39181.1 GNAT family N-acetyltransferase [Mumia zhuanghuii]TNC42897.1 GNAT family N-acetyltransferase [Mumia zhuanghuii]